MFEVITGGLDSLEEAACSGVTDLCNQELVDCSGELRYNCTLEILGTFLDMVCFYLFPPSAEVL